jgi:hypothetical protein
MIFGLFYVLLAGMRAEVVDHYTAPPRPNRYEARP